MGTKKLYANIRWMIRSDMPAVLAIEKASFEFPWSMDNFSFYMRQRHGFGMVAEYEKRIVGFMIYDSNVNRLHLLNFAVKPDSRRCGVGQQMIKMLISKLSIQDRNSILLEVRETNLNAQFFFRELGFQAISVLRDFYDDAKEDAYRMQYRHKKKNISGSINQGLD